MVGNFFVVVDMIFQEDMIVDVQMIVVVEIF